MSTVNKGNDCIVVYQPASESRPALPIPIKGNFLDKTNQPTLRKIVLQKMIVAYLTNTFSAS